MEINVQAPINFLGYGVAGTNIVKALLRLGHKVHLTDIGPRQITEADSKILAAVQPKEFFFYAAPSLRIFHQNSMAESIGAGQRCGFPIFELDTFTSVEKHHLNSLDTIFVASDWAQDVIFDNNIVEPWVKVVPLGVDRSIFHENLPKKTCAETVFINVGKWEVRKGHNELLEAFNKAFTPSDNVRLIMHCDNPFTLNGPWQDLYLRSKMGRAGKIFISSTRFNTQQQLAELMNLADCGVFPSKAEGFNLEALEILSMGKNIIITNYSAHTQYATQNNSLLIPINETEPAHDNIWFKGQGNWAKFGEEQMQSLIDNMKYVHNMKQGDCKMSVNVMGIDTAKRFSWDATAEAIIDRM